MRLPMDIIWFSAVGGFVLMAASLWYLGSDSVPILTAGIPSMFGLCGWRAWIQSKAVE